MMPPISDTRFTALLYSGKKRVVSDLPKNKAAQMSNNISALVSEFIAAKLMVCS